MDAYTLVLGIWLGGFALAGLGTVWHLGHWRQMTAFRHYLYHGTAPRDAPVDSILGGWLRDAVFHLGLRVLLVLFALERVALQLVIPPAERGAFAASPLQLGLALLYLLILVWITRWSWLQQQAQAARLGADVQGYGWMR